MNVVFAPRAWDDYLHWQESDQQMIARIHLLIKEIMRDPHRGIGKPELLKHALKGYWSRRLNSEHRIVYRVSGGQLFILQLQYHY